MLKDLLERIRRLPFWTNIVMLVIWPFFSLLDKPYNGLAVVGFAYVSLKATAHSLTMKEPRLGLVVFIIGIVGMVISAIYGLMIAL